MPPLNRRRLAAKRRMQALRLRYPDGLRNKPVDLPVQETVEEEQTVIQTVVEETFENQPPEELVEETIEEIQIVEVGVEETPPTEETAPIEEDLVEEILEEIQVPDVALGSEDILIHSINAM